MDERKSIVDKAGASLNFGDASKKSNQMKSEKSNSNEPSTSRHEVVNSLNAKRSSMEYDFSNIIKKNQIVKTFDKRVTEEPALDKYTMERLSSWLRSYEPKDVLNEDELMDQMTKFKEDSSKHRVRECFEVNDPLDLVCLSSDEDDVDVEDDSWKYSSTKSSKLIIESSFFGEVVKGVLSQGLDKKASEDVQLGEDKVACPWNPLTNKESVSQNQPYSYSSLCQKTLNEIKKSLGIEVKTEDKIKKRRGRPSSSKGLSNRSRISPNQLTQDHTPSIFQKSQKISEQVSHEDASFASSRPLTRRMARDTRIKLREERNDRKNRGVDLLVIAMLELEKNINSEKEDCHDTKVSKTLDDTPIPSARNKKRLSKRKKPKSDRIDSVIGVRERVKSDCTKKPNACSDRFPNGKSTPTQETDRSQINGGHSNEACINMVNLNPNVLQKKGDYQSAIYSASLLKGEFPSNHDTRKPHSPRSKTKMNYIIAKVSCNRGGKSMTLNPSEYRWQGIKHLKVTKVIVNGRKFKGCKNKTQINMEESLSIPKGQPLNVTGKRKRSQETNQEDAYISNEESVRNLCHTIPNSTTESSMDSRSENNSGFGTNHTHGFSDKKTCNDVINQDSIPSLGLLDWRRRQQWLVTKENGNGSDPSKSGNIQHGLVFPRGSLPVGIDIGLPSLETTISLFNSQEKTSKVGRQKLRHSSHLYASWCSKLINCLQGSGRSMARYEFFYSDIDRPWFNRNPFREDLCRLGVPLFAKLTRSEWSFVRRHIKNRPRRFSQRFINLEMKKLQKYREQIRRVQSNADNLDGSSLPFEVPAFIRVGATVTAFNKKARILHRGSVLLHDLRSNQYLVQFERKELGCEFCPDIEVASHGVPEFIKPIPGVSLDGSIIGNYTDHNTKPGVLPYGTTYGHISENMKKGDTYSTNESARKASNINQHLGSPCSKSQPNLGTPKIKNGKRRVQPQEHLLSHSNYTKDTLRIEKATEREILVKLMGTLDALITRKSCLLDVLEKLESILLVFTDASKMSAKDVLNERSNKHFRRYYSWVTANLKVNEQRLESAALFLNVMYGKIYSGRSQNSRISQDIIKKNINKKLSERYPIPLDSSLTDSWVKALCEGSAKIANDLCSKFLSGKIFLKDDHDVTYDEITLGVKVEVIATLLSICAITESLLDNFHMDVQTDESEFSIHCDAMFSILNSSLERLKPSPPKHDFSDQITQAKSHLEGSFETLSSAVATLHAEYSALLITKIC